MSNITSIRYGHATNSSSSHSIVACRDVGRLPHVDKSTDEFSYGWEKFILSSVEEKMAYLLTDYFPFSEPDDWFVQPLKRFDGKNGFSLQALLDRHDAAINTKGFASPWGIDHESSGLVHPPMEVSFDEWLDVLMDDKVVILGGNDNVEETFASELVNDGKLVLTKIKGWRNTIKRDGDAIIFHDAQSGTKFRWSKQPYLKSSTPELVDIKITDKCSYGCSFCYQGSTPEGEDAPLGRIKSIIDTLAAAKVFEIAIGGGEPTQHKDFPEILRYAADKGVNPNFTTFTSDWIYDREIVEAIGYVAEKGRGMGIGVSILAEKDLGKLEDIRDALRHDVQIIGQTVIGVAPISVTRKMVKEMAKGGKSVLLLGYKNIGRGEDFSARLPDKSEVKDMIAEFRDHKWSETRFYGRNNEHSHVENHKMWSALSVDTAFLDQYGEVLDDLNVDAALRTSPEGAFSMYVDAVNMTAGPSSWHPEDLQPINGAEDILPLFTTLAPIPIRGNAAEAGQDNLTI